MSNPSVQPMADRNGSILHLEQVMAEFNRVSSELGGAWSELENRVARLTGELAAARSERLRELAAKEALADKLTALMEAMPAAIVVIGADDRIEELNATARMLLGASPEGRCWSEVLRELGGRTISSGEFDSVAGQRLSLAYSKLGGHSRIALLTDITEGHRLSQLLQREQRLSELGDMAARLAHQLRTPLSSAMLYLSQLGNDPASDAVPVISARALERLRDIEQLIHGMLRFIRGAEEPVAEFCPSALAREVVSAMAAQFSAARARLSLDIADHAPLIRGRRELLSNALGNLLDNALASCGSDARISLTVDAGDRCVRLSVTDNGPGVEPSLEESIFEPWFTTRVHGTGLGLAIVRSAAEAHGGRVELQQPLDGGSCFTLIIPTHPATEGSSEDSP